MNSAPPSVLVVEDEPQLATVYRTWLADRYSVHSVHTGWAAIEAFETTDGDFDVVFLDRRLPDISGDEVLEIIRDRSFDGRVAMLTAVSPDIDIIFKGIDDYVLKPVTRRELIGTVESLVALDRYDEQLQEYYRLIAKQAALKSNGMAELDEIPVEYRRLTAEIDRHRRELGRLQEGFNEEQYLTLYRDVSG